jgi:RNA polymerase sigma-70 factor (ECF subfamily)
MGAWITEARNGSADALGHLLETCRQYLLLVANKELTPGLQAKVGASDVVQETFLKAQRHFDCFHGGTEAELLAWLRRILLNNLANITRHYHQTAKRAVRSEITLPERMLIDLANAGGDPISSPSRQAIAREEDGALQRALQELPAHYRQVIVWRNWENRSFAEIGQELGRTPPAARKLWARAIEQLHLLVEAHESRGSQSGG